jgi:CheY-like chemotaxis protein
MLGEDISLRCELSEDLWTAHADPSQVQDAILNLAVNARDAMQVGGQLVIETANAQLDKHYAAQNAEVTPGDYTVLTIADSGTGMRADVIERAFEPFFTTKEVGSGTGLGLSMVYGFMKQSRGHIKIYSEVGHGTSIRLYFPRGGAASTQGAVKDPVVEPASAANILLVEDSEAVRAVAREMLSSLGYNVIEAVDGPSALLVLRSAEPIDLLFTDMIMPNKITGADLLQEARKLRPNIRALFTSGYSEHFLKGVDGTQSEVLLLSKPYRKQSLATAVHSALQSELP